MNNTRLEATKAIWAAAGFALVALFIGAGIGNGFNVFQMVVGIVIAVMATGATGFVWNFGEYKDSDMMHGELSATEKAKRDRLDNVIRDLSSEELEALRQRLQDGTINDDMLYERMGLSDDGELVVLDRNR